MNDKMVNSINKKIRKFNLFYIDIFLIICTLLIIAIYNSYSKYVSSISSDADMTIASWKIYVNNQDITNGANLNNVIMPVFPGNNNVASGVIAPETEGYFDVVIDASDTDVSFRYTITTSDNEDSAVSDLIISGYSIDGGERQNVVDNGNGFEISNTILYNSQDKDVSLRVYIKWNDDSNDGATMDNDDDTETTLDETNLAKVNVNLRFIQVPLSDTTTTTTTTTEGGT